MQFFSKNSLIKSIEKTVTRLKKALIKFFRKLPYIRGVLNKIKIKYQNAKFSKKLKKQTPVFVYQMGKVASSSVYKSISKYYKGNVIHAHSFRMTHKQHNIRLLYQYNQKGNVPIKLISLVRQPIERNISAFFENFHRDTSVEFDSHTFSLKELKEIFLKNYNHEIPLVWFDNNIKKNFGIDVFNYPFPSSGYQVIKKNNVQLLLMKHNVEDSIKEKIIKEFLSINKFQILNKNIGNKKNYANTYSEFRKAKFPKWYIDKMILSKYMKHFYYDEIHLSISKWSSIVSKKKH